MNSFNFIVSSTSTCGEKSEIKIYYDKIYNIFIFIFFTLNYYFFKIKNFKFKLKKILLTIKIN
ncbi:hypothetical protein [Spiroplasma ixodetis]|uniref:hypothetical protein n=1 Tax=Spiroplasma ixodetis TaxID=2141 RepID=UPI0025762C7C|nr:hypothetical protein [Spiroplasma ixodetis]